MSNRVWMSEHKLRRHRHKLVPDVPTRDRVSLLRIDDLRINSTQSVQDRLTDLEDSVGLRRSVRPPALCDWRFLNGISHTKLVVARRRLRIERHGHAVLLDYRVTFTEFTHCRIDPEREEVLMVWREDPGADYCAVWRGLAWEDCVSGQNAGCAGLKVDVGGLVEFPAEDVLTSAGHI